MKAKNHNEAIRYGKSISTKCTKDFWAFLKEETEIVSDKEENSDKNTK